MKVGNVYINKHSKKEARITRIEEDRVYITIDGLDAGLPKNMFWNNYEAKQN